MSHPRLVFSQPEPNKRACSTCRHRKVAYCGATGDSIRSARMFESFACGTSGKLWEKELPPEPWPGLVTIIRRFLFGREKP